MALNERDRLKQRLLLEKGSGSSNEPIPTPPLDPVTVSAVGGTVDVSGSTVDASGSTVEITNAGGIIDTANSSTTPLGIGGTFTGQAVNILPYAGIGIIVSSDASGTLTAEFSPDGSNWFSGETYTIEAGATKFFAPPTQGAYYRLVYVNDGTAQTTFDLHPVLKYSPFKWSSHNIDDPIKDEDDAVLTKSVITGKKASGDYDNVSLTNGGNMKISLEELESGISSDSNSKLNVLPYPVDEFGNYWPLLSDPIFAGALVTIPAEHHEIHCGDAYLAKRTVDVASASTDEIIIVVPNEAGTGQSQKLYHMIVEGICELEGQWDLYEGPTYSAAGTAITSYNKNRNSTNTDTLAITHTPTLTTDGTLIDSVHLGSGRNFGGEGRYDEWILKNNTAYLARFTNSVTGSANYITWRFKYYVHPGV